MTQDAEAGARLVLQGALTMRTADTVHATLRDAIERPADAAAGTILIDCVAATEVDLTFIQLLIASRISAVLRGKAVALAAAPDGALLDTLTRGGFQVADESGPDNTPAFWFAGAVA
jgi:ABC-type transporter Mla MlaB component